MAKQKRLTMDYEGRKFVLVTAPGGVCAGCAFAGDAAGCEAASECAGGMWREYETDRYQVEESFYDVVDKKEHKYDKPRLCEI